MAEQMIAALDVHYGSKSACAAGILFEDWTSAVAAVQVVENVATIEPYEPGNFYRRELPCLLVIADRLGAAFDVAIVDGYAWLGSQNRPGLGGHLFEALGKTVPVIGVAKSFFKTGPRTVPIVRGRSRRPLYVSAAGIDTNQAARNIGSMHGPHRIPTMLKLVDRLSRQTD
jgi:deoxyribonuclease V